MPAPRRAPAFQRPTPQWLIDDLFKAAGKPVVRKVRNSVRTLISKENQLTVAKQTLQRRDRNVKLNAIQRAEEWAKKTEARTGRRVPERERIDYANKLIAKSNKGRVQAAVETNKRLKRELADVEAQARAYFKHDSDFTTAVRQEKRLVEKGWSPSRRGEKAGNLPPQRTPKPAPKGKISAGPSKKKVPEQFLKKK